MKTNSIYKVIAVITLLLAANICAQAQIGGNIGDRIKSNAKRKVENKIVNEANKATNKAVDKTYEKAKNSTKKSTDKSVEKAKKDKNKSTDKTVEQTVEEVSSSNVDSESNSVSENIENQTIETESSTEAIEPDEEQYGDKTYIKTDNPIYKGACKYEIYSSPEPVGEQMDNLAYYMWRIKKATEQKDIEKMTGPWYFSMSEFYKKVAESNQLITNEKRWKTLHDEYWDVVIAEWKKVLYPPRPAELQENISNTDKPRKKKQFYACEKYDMENRIKKQVKGGNAQRYYISMELGIRELAINMELIDEKDTEYADYMKDLTEVWNDMSDDFKAEYPLLTQAELEAKFKARDEKWAKEKAEQKAKLEAEIAASTKPWPKSNMGSEAFLAQCVKLINAQYPELNARAASVINTTWQIDRTALGEIQCRRISAWIDCKDEGTGKRIAKKFGFAQDYMGGGKYGNTRLHNIGLGDFWIK